MAVVFWPVLGFDFVDWDDPAYVLENPAVLGGITSDGVRWAFQQAWEPYWHPLTWLSHMADVEWFALDAGGHHLSSLVLHLLNVLLVQIVVHRLTGRPLRAVLVAVLFGLHPLHVESVAWVAERKDVLSTAFVLLTVLAYLSFVKQRSVARYVVVCVTFGCALMAKPMAVTLPLLLLLLDVWPLARWRSIGDGWSMFVEKIPLMLLSAATAVATYVAQDRVGTMASLTSLPAATRTLNAAESVVGYLRKTLWPSDLAAFYPYATDSAWWRGALAVAVVVSISALVVSVRRSRPHLLFGWAWFLIGLLPVLGLIQVGNQAMADRFTYLPLVGVFVVLTWEVAERLTSHATRRLAGVLTVVVLVATAVAARSQVATWANSGTMWSQVLRVSPASAYAHSAYGTYRARVGDYVGAERSQREALRLNPNDPDANNELGVLLIRQGEREAAIPHFSRAVAGDGRLPEARHNLGSALLAAGRLDEALGHLVEAVRLRPSNAGSRRALGEALARIGRFEDALVQQREAARLDPASGVIQNDLGVTLGRLGRLREAIGAFEGAVASQPEVADFHVNLGVALLQDGQRDRALQQFRDALRLAPNDARLVAAVDAAIARRHK